MAMSLVNRNEGSPPFDTTRQASALQGGIGLGHRAQTDLQCLGKIPVRGQTIASRQPAFDDVTGQG